MKCCEYGPGTLSVQNRACVDEGLIGKFARSSKQNSFVSVANLFFIYNFLQIKGQHGFIFRNYFNYQK